MRSRNLNARLVVEHLETREVPAGIVTAQLIGDTLVVTGDQFDNYVQLYRDETGLHVEDQTFQGVNNLVIDLANGDDHIEISRLHLDGNLFIDTGEGRDGVHAYFLNVGGDAEIRTGANGGGGPSLYDGERVSLERLNVGGTLTIDTGTGDDYVELGHYYGPLYPHARVGNLVIDTGEGNDYVHLVSLEVVGDVRLDGGNGQFDYLSAYFIGDSLIRNIENFEW
jgi:hypothetical protein